MLNRCSKCGQFRGSASHVCVPVQAPPVPTAAVPGFLQASATTSLLDSRESIDVTYARFAASKARLEEEPTQPSLFEDLELDLADRDGLVIDLTEPAADEFGTDDSGQFELMPADAVPPAMSEAELAERENAHLNVLALQSRLDVLVGQTIPKPPSGASGHAIGTPVEDLVAARIAEAYGDRAHLPHDMLNSIIAAHPEAVTVEERHALLGEPARARLVARSDKSMRETGPDNPLKSGQSATADVCIIDGDLDHFRDSHVILIDAKAAKVGDEKKSRPPNIISSQKLCEALHLHKLSRSSVTNFDMLYAHVELVDDPADDTRFKVQRVRVVDLFKIPPTDLYINFTAGQQVQVDLSDISQSFTGSRQDWAQQFLLHRSESHTKWISRMVTMNEQFQQMAADLPGLSLPEGLDD